MAVAMDIGWRSPSFHLGSDKKRGWGEDQQKLLQLMIGQPIDEGTSATTTLDLLGGSSTSSTSSYKEQPPLDLELDMEMPPPSGWEKRLDLKFGKFYYVNLSTGKSTYEHPSKQPCTESQQFLSLGRQSTALREKESSVAAARRWDLQSELDRIDMKDESQLDLKLNLGGGGCLPVPKSLSSIEAVQEALRRSQAATTTTTTSISSKQQMPFLSPATSTSSSSSSKMNSRSTDASESIEKLSVSSSAAFVAEVVDSKIRQAPAAADAKVVLTGCKRCLMYVMLTRSDPRCPKCGSSVVLDIPLQQQQLAKRSRLELDL